jgi:tetratricopeptide (TPR) repeat protein
MRGRCIILALALILAAGCAGTPDRGTLAQLHSVQPDVAEVQVQDTLDLAMQSYRRFLEETPTGAMTPEAMRRLADLQLEREFGIAGDGDRWVELPAPETGVTPHDSRDTAPPGATEIAVELESDADFERRATEQQQFAPAEAPDLGLPGAESAAQAGPLEAISIYQRLLIEYPSYERADQVLYQMARAYDELGRTEEAMEVTERLIAEYGYSKYLDEVQFRRGEYFFTRRMFREAESAYQSITAMGPQSEFYELALYKFGWTLYKQEFYEEALHQYMALLDYKLSIGYDFDAAHEEEDERRVTDTFRVISLSFSNLGGPEVPAEYYATYGHRSFEDRIYQNLGEFYFDKLRYNDAAKTYDSFVELYPFHQGSPGFSMRVIDIYEAGGFPILVLEAKKEFATQYGLQGEYWRHFDTAERPDVLSYLKTNLKDLANHYHALYQEEGLAEGKPTNYAEALVWYREFLASFPLDAESPDINYQLADLHLENQDYVEAAHEYERTAYDYPPHERAAAAGYAAIYAHREHLRTASAEEETAAKRATVLSSLKFADTFPEHEHAATVLGAAAEDLYAMNDFAPAAAAARTLIERYPSAATPLKSSAWTVVAHSSLELADYPAAEQAYSQVLALTPPDDPSRQALVDNLAASIYKQGEQANQAGDYRAAADHFLRIKATAPVSAIRPAAEYDAAAALMQLQDWTAAAAVLDDFRSAFPDHELQREATKQLAFVYREDGELSLAAGEYERVAAESADQELRREALLAAGDLYEQAQSMDQALTVYERYVGEFPAPVEVAVETRFKVAGMYEAKGDQTRYHEALAGIVAADADAGIERTDRTRYVAAQSALVLTEPLYGGFTEVKLVQPFEQSLARKRELMDRTLRELEKLIDYEVAEVTAAATFYMAEVYYDFARSLLESERPTGLDAAELAEYEEVIEEEAFPFEDLAIEVHEKNLELTAAGVYNRWIENSVGRLADLMPGRYAKEEESFGFLGSLESFTYVSPAVAALAEAGAYAAQPVETAGRAGRRVRGGTQKGTTAHLEVTEGTGFTITEQARIGAEVRTQYESALRYLEQGLYELGIAALVQVTERAPELASPYIELGMAYSRAGDLERAEASLVKALDLSGAHPVAHNELGLIYRRRGRFALARESYEQSLAAYAELHFARKNLAILCDLYLRDLVCALENYEAYSALVPEDAQAAIWIADIRSRLNP